MKNFVSAYAAAHRVLLEAAARGAGLRDPVAICPDAFHDPLLKAARKGPPLPVDGVLVRDWDPMMRGHQPGVCVGMRHYELDGIRFVCVRFAVAHDFDPRVLSFFAVERQDYLRLYRLARRCRLDAEPPSLPPVLPQEQLDVLWKNTIGYLDRANLRRLKAYGGRAQRGILLIGAPGNGKTMACRWIWEECRRRCWEYQLVTPDAYQAARRDCNPVEAVRELFTVQRRGIIFFDDMDVALRDRETVQETDDQAVFLGALDGIQVHEGVVFVFTSNCAPELIDRAFKRPGRLDLVLHFKTPDDSLRRGLVERWHAEILAHIDVATIVSSTDGCSFAELEELKNLLIMHFMERGEWRWSLALEQFDVNRRELNGRRHRKVGFSVAADGHTGNGR